MGRRDVTRRARPARAAAAAVVAGGALVALAGAGWITWRLTRPVAAAGPADVERNRPERAPPDFPAPRTETERIQRLLEMLLNGDTDDAMWARRMLAEAGEPARKTVAETASRCLDANRMFVEHALEFLLRDARPSDVPLAVQALASPDPECQYRGLAILAKVGDAAAREAIPKIGAIATESWPAPRYALNALSRLGGAEAVAELERLAMAKDLPVGVADLALAQMGTIGGERAREVLLREMDAAEGGDRFIAAAEGLVAMGDPAPVPRLRETLLAGRSEQALALLARARDADARAELDARIRGPLESAERREIALRMLESFPIAERVELLRHAAASRNPREVRVEAWRQLVKDGDPSDRDDLVRLLHAEGPNRREDRFVAALALATWQNPASGRALAAAEAAATDDEELRTILLRALVIVGDPGTAEAVVRSMASDPAEPGTGNARAFEAAILFQRPPQGFRDAVAPWVVKALRGELGTVAPKAMASLVLAARAACGRDAAGAIEPFLTHPDRHLASAAAAALVDLAGPNSLAALRNAWWHPQAADTRDEIVRSLERILLAHPVR